MFKKACKSHSSIPVISKGEEVSKFGGVRRGGVQLTDPKAFVVVVILNGDL